jgi:hypothetical protein
VDDNTAIYRNGEDAALTDIQPGDSVGVAIDAPAGSTPDQVLATPAFIVAAYSQTAFYGFAGRVTQTDTTAGTVTVAVRRATPNAQGLLSNPGPTLLTFVTDEDTRFLGAQDLDSVKVGDVVGVGLEAAAGISKDQLLATPASFVLDLHGRKRSARSLERLSKTAARGAQQANPGAGQ